MNFFYISIGAIVLGLIFIVVGWFLSTPITNFPTNTKFKINQNELCADSDSVATEEKPKILLKKCMNEPNQEFTYDITGKLIKNPNKNLCVEDGMGSDSKFYKLNKCDSESKLQKFDYDPKDKRIVRKDGELKSCAVNSNNMLASGPCSDGSFDPSRQFNINTL